MSGIGQDNIVKKEVDKNKAGEIIRQLGYIQEKAQKNNQYEIIFADGDQFYVISPFKKIGIPVEKIVGQQMKKQTPGNRGDIGPGIGAVAVLHASGKDGECKGQKNAEAFHCEQSVVLNKPLFLTVV